MRGEKVPKRLWVQVGTHPHVRQPPHAQTARQEHPRVGFRCSKEPVVGTFSSVPVIRKSTTRTEETAW